MDDLQRELLSIYLKEYEKLKDEQVARISLRDNLIFATLIAFGGLLSFSLSDPRYAYALLALPLVTFVIGLTYISNDRKISDIGLYLRTTLVERMQERLGATRFPMLEWEQSFRKGRRRTERKLIQLLVNQALFVGTGVAALAAYARAAPAWSLTTLLIALVEAVCLLILARELWLHADIGWAA